MPPETFPGLKISPKCVCGWAPPGTPLGELQRSPDPLVGLGEGKGRKMERRGDERRGRERKKGKNLPKLKYGYGPGETKSKLNTRVH